MSGRQHGIYDSALKNRRNQVVGRREQTYSRQGDCMFAVWGQELQDSPKSSPAVYASRTYAIFLWQQTIALRASQSLLLKVDRERLAGHKLLDSSGSFREFGRDGE